MTAAEHIPANIQRLDIVLGVFSTRQAALDHAKDLASCVANGAILALVLGIEPRNGMYVLTYKGTI